METGGKLTMLLGFMPPSCPTPPVLPYGLLILGDIPEIRQGSVKKKKPNQFENLDKMTGKTQEGRGSQNLKAQRVGLVCLMSFFYKCPNTVYASFI